MRIATWNVQSLRKLYPEREAAFHSAMANVVADVWVLTETWKTFSPGEGYRLMAESILGEDLKIWKTWADRRWVTIWVKSDLHAKHQKVKIQPDRMACCRIEMPDVQDIVVVGTLLPWGSNDYLWPGLDGFCTSLVSQAAEWRAMRGEQKNCTLVVAGDFNQSIPFDECGYKRGETILNKALKNLDLMCLTQGKCQFTNKPRIDHICVSRSGFDPESPPQSKNWEIPSCNGKPVTDHSGVYVDLEAQNIA